LIIGIQPQQAVEDQIDDVSARGVGMENGVEDLGVADGSDNELVETVRVADGLTVVGRNPEIGLQKDHDQEQGHADQRVLRLHLRIPFSPKA